MASSITPSATTAPPPAPAGGGAASSAAAIARQEVAASGKAAPPAVQVVAREAPRQSAQELAQATRDISDYIQTVSRSLQIAVDSDLGSTIITVIDKATDEVVRQIPSEEVVALARFLSQQQAELGGSDLPVKGLLMDSES